MLVTFRQARCKLERDRYIGREQGSGTFVAEPPPAANNPLRVLACRRVQPFSSAPIASRRDCGITSYMGAPACGRCRDYFTAGQRLCSASAGN